MNLRCIETFICVAECSSFRRAAELLHRSQSAVSVHVQLLEDELGVPLFDRTTRRVALTAEGRTLLSRTKVVVAELRSVADELREASGIRGGVVDVGITPSLGAAVLPAALAEFSSRFPRVNVRLHEAVARGLYESVRQRKTDFAVGPAVPGLKDFDYQVISREPLLAILPPDYPLQSRKAVTLKELLAQPLLAMPVGTYLRRVLEDAAAARGERLQPRLELGSFGTVLAQVEAGIGVSVLPALAVSPDWRARLQTARIRAPALAWDNCILRLKGKRLSPPAARLADLITTMAAVAHP